MKENSTKILFKSKKTKKENKDKINKNEKKGIKDIKMENKNLNNKTEKKMMMKCLKKLKEKLKVILWTY